MTVLTKITPNSMESQIIAVLTLSFLLLLTVLVGLEIQERRTVLEWAESKHTLNRVKFMRFALDNIDPDQRALFLQTASLCHEGYTVTDAAFAPMTSSTGTNQLQTRIMGQLALENSQILAGGATLDRNDFSYSTCSESEIDLPLDAIVISLRLESGQWLNTEVHPHEWHIQDMVFWILRYSIAFVIVGIIAIFFLRRLSKPLNNLTGAARQFGKGLKVSPVIASGPPDLRRAIESFNDMQQQVTDEVNKRTNTLAAISHDVRTPLTALRLKAELVEDEDTRKDLISSIDKMEKITESALEFLRDQTQTEPLREVDLSALVERECSEFEEMGHTAVFTGAHNINYRCRPAALARAIRNLIENAIKYGKEAMVTVQSNEESVDISISDQGPGIDRSEIERVFEPFARLSTARESSRGGFGLGLPAANTIVESHGGSIELTNDEPVGLTAAIHLPTRTE